MRVGVTLVVDKNHKTKVLPNNLRHKVEQKHITNNTLQKINNKQTLAQVWQTIHLQLIA